MNFIKMISTKILKTRFNYLKKKILECAGTLKGYGNQWKTYHPIFHTSNSEYGWLPPNVHTVPHR